jgi:tryptophan synthase beta subunit
MNRPIRNAPIRNARFGDFGGCYVPETLHAALVELDAAWRAARRDPAHRRELAQLLRDYVGRPSPLYEAHRLARAWGGRARVFLKREDLNHTGAHKINNSLGQALLARRIGKRRVIAETGAGQHGVATATACALLGLQCRVYMGAVDVERQRPNVQRMRLLGAEVVAVTSGTRTLKDATNEAIRDWVTHVRTTHYVLGSTVGPAPYPRLVRDLQSVIGREARRQMLAQAGRLPDVVVACVGGGSNALGIFSAFLKDARVGLVGVEGGGEGRPGRTAATLCFGRPGVLHGARSYLLQDAAGQVAETHSISAGLDYPGVGPEHSFLKESGRVTYVEERDRAALAAFVELCRCEGIVPALESCHALAHARRLARRSPRGRLLLVNLSGRGDKDLDTVERLLAKGNQ